MRCPRIKINPEEGDAVYHCVTRTVNGERLFDDRAKEVLRKQLWQVADYCGVQVLTYAIMSNHFHVLLKVPRRTAVTDDELLRRYRVLYPKPTRYQQARIEVIAELLKEPNNPEAEAWRKRQLALMGDVSPFMKLLKQRFAIWFNRTHERFGTLWCERFKSLLVEGSGRALQATAAYIDLNAVRANIVTDPKDYRFCGYGEAVAGNALARENLGKVVGEDVSWRQLQASYRQMLFCIGAAPRGMGRGSTLPAEEVSAVMKAKGQLPLPVVLRCRVRYFTDGAVLGSREFVQGQIEAHQKRLGRQKKAVPRPLPALTDWWGDLTTLRGLRKNAIG